ncbi:MAG: dephospho-CoA kinase [Parasphingorhabdus sp.]|nr:dephospho-CoA kinase [Parasphingorhabdus sp.]
MKDDIPKKQLIIGLTGSIGMGKSTVAKMFVEEGVPLFDADVAVRAMQGPGGALVQDIENLFPGTTGDSGVDRQKLGALVFGNADKLRDLELLIHPAVAAMRHEFLLAHKDDPLILFDIPLLFEKAGRSGIDHVVVVSAPPEIQRERVLERKGMTPEKFAQIDALQTPDTEKREGADSVIDTGQSLADTRQAVKQLIRKLKALLA